MKKQLFLFLALAQAYTCFSQNRPAFKSLRYEEDYTSLKTDSSHHWYTRTKYQPLSGNGRTYLSFGGDIRYQYFWFKNEDWGEAPTDKDGYMLTRYLAHADFHSGSHFRGFVQLQSSFANGKETPPSSVEENPLNLHQAFFDVALPLNQSNTLTARIGRQELLYGSQRLVAVREGPNNRQSFDAAKLMYQGRRWKVDAFYSHYVLAQHHIFGDGFNQNTKFWGGYAVINHVPVFHNLDVYYLGLWKRQATFDEGKAQEMRHSIGTRLWNSQHNFRYDIEGLYQFGKFGDHPIDAWTLSFNAGYQFAQAPLQPEIGLKTELISGDATHGDNQLQTFNPLFPRGAYFGLAALIGPSNLIDVHPSISLELSQKVDLNLDYDAFWRYSRNDAIYAPNVSIIYLGENTRERSIGNQVSTDLVYTPNNFLYFRGEFTWFMAGDFLKEAGPGKDILFTAVTVQLKF
jgi:hypothetical protein